MTHVVIILTLPKEGELAEVNVLKQEAGQNNLLAPHVAQDAELPSELWQQLVAGDELDDVAQAAFELGRRYEKGEFDSLVN